MLSKNVLILTPSLGFGEMIRQVLEDAGGFQPRLLAAPQQGMDWAARDKVSLLILDADFEELDLQAYIAEMRSLSPDMHLFMIPVEKRPNDPLLNKLGADAILPSPFYLPNLVHAIEQLYGPLTPKETVQRASYGAPPAGVRTSHQEEASAAPEWLQDVSLAAQYLTGLSFTSASRAALITRGDQVWAYAGELPKRAAEELADAVAQQGAAGADLARFVHLQATDADYMLYATGLGGEFTLALVFDAQMPFSQMRAQASELANALTHSPEVALARAEAARQNNVRLSEDRGGDASQQPPAPNRPNFEPATPRNPLPTSQPASRNSQAAPREPHAAPRYTTGMLRGVTGGLAALTADGTDLQYSFVFVPRLPSHQLDGDLGDKLGEWLPQLCIAFAWRLESISIQPNFMQWTVSLPADTPVDSVAQTLDKYLSERVFEEFPKLRRDNPSGQFWAPTVLILNASSVPAASITEFIQETRARQGLPRQS
jgi:REP element-mobilizing transposase RayT/DNA-binding NarL/FixJ family response regulator